MNTAVNSAQQQNDGANNTANQAGTTSAGAANANANAGDSSQNRQNGNTVPAWMKQARERAMAQRDREAARAAQLEEENRQLRERLTQFDHQQNNGNAGNNQNNQQPNNQNQQRQEQQERPGNRQQEVDAQAERIVAQREFARRCDDTLSRGKAEFPTFESDMAQLREVGDISGELLGTITESEIGHKILHYLANNPDEAAAIYDANPRTQARRIGQIEAKLMAAKAPDPSPSDDDAGGEPSTAGQGRNADTNTNQAPAQPAKLAKAAPAPIKPNAGANAGGNTSTVPTDKDDIGTWMKKRNDQVRRNK